VDVVTRAEAAELLMTAYRTGTAVEPLAEKYAGLTLDDSYEIQLLQIARRVAAGARVKGHKVGLTSPAMQRQMNVDQPDFGHLLDDMFHLENVAIPADSYLQPRIEPEVAFVLRRDLRGPGVTVAEAAAAVDFVLPALEIIDSRIRDWKIGILDTIADNASSGGVVLGSTPTALGAVDLRLSGCVLHRNGGAVVGTGAGGAVLGSPLTSLVWLVNTLGARGVGLEAGHVVLPGSITASIPVAAGDSFTATFAGLGSVTARFAAGPPAGSQQLSREAS
jgi:2-keto-4-pentenoate hydratase